MVKRWSKIVSHTLDMRSEATEALEEDDVVTLKMVPESECSVQIGASSIIGTRSNQEDAMFSSQKGEETIAAVCDGMGGLAKGELASRVAIESIARAWANWNDTCDIPEFLEREAIKADEKVFSQKNQQGEKMHAGTTIVAAIVKENKLYWLSVGDSKIYFIRDGEIFSINREHNYRLILNRKLEQGELTADEYVAEEYRAEALISYIGMGNVSLIDVSREPITLEDGDVVLLSSDGLYKSLSENEILSIVNKTTDDVQNMAETLTAVALGEKVSGQDNTSVIAMKYLSN